MTKAYLFVTWYSFFGSIVTFVAKKIPFYYTIIKNILYLQQSFLRLRYFKKIKPADIHVGSGNEIVEIGGLLIPRSELEGSNRRSDAVNSKDKKIKIAFVGAGRRFQNIYLPLVSKLKNEFQVVGFTTRTRSKGESISSRENIPLFNSLQSLVQGSDPDLLVICVSPKENARVMMEALALRVAVLCETPLATSVSQCKKLERFAEKHSSIAGIVEQTPFLPLEQFKRLIIQEGLIGEVRVVENDFQSYNYHAIAQLRSYFVKNLIPKVAQSSRSEMPLEQRNQLEIWDIGTVTFSSGELLIHNFSSHYNDLPFRKFNSLRIYGEKGTIMNNTLLYLDDRNETQRVSIEINKKNDSTEEIRCTLPSGRAFVWRNPFHEFKLTDDQTGIAMHLFQIREAILYGKSPLYEIREARQDVEIFEALKLSGYLGAQVKFPLCVMKERIRLLTKWRIVKKIMAKRLRAYFHSK